MGSFGDGLGRFGLLRHFWSSLVVKLSTYFLDAIKSKAWYNKVMQILNKLLTIIQEKTDELVGTLLLLFILGLGTGVAGAVYLERRLDWHEAQMMAYKDFSDQVLTGKLPVIDTKIFDSSTPPQLVPAALYYIREIKALKEQVAELQAKGGAKATPAPTPQPKFQIP